MTANLHEFARWLAENENKLPQVFQVYKKSTLKEIASGKKPIETIPAGKILRLYELTQLECFKPRTKFNPAQFSGRALSRGEYSREDFHNWLDYNGMTRKDFASSIGVSEDLFANFLYGRDISDSAKAKIVKGLEAVSGADYKKKKEPVATEIGQETQRARPDKSDLGIMAQINKALGKLNSTVQDVRLEIAGYLGGERAAEVLSNTVPVSLEQRIKTVNLAIDVLVGQVDYFRKAPQNEREKLSGSIDADTWGYVVGILSKIDAPGSYETVLRAFEQPRRDRR